jgi:hypothetical protein
MKIKNISSSELPEIDNSVKECINLGKWLLFKSSSIGDGQSCLSYYLKTDEQVFELDIHGNIQKPVSRDGLSIHIDELCYFSDISRPRSLSNTASKCVAFLA